MDFFVEVHIRSDADGDVSADESLNVTSTTLDLILKMIGSWISALGLSLLSVECRNFVACVEQWVTPNVYPVSLFDRGMARNAGAAIFIRCYRGSFLCN